MSKNIGVVGLGRMGKPIAKNIIESGYETFVTDVRPDPMQELEEFGAVGVDAPKDLGRRCDIIIIVVQDAEQTREVVLGPEGIAAGVDSDTVVIVSATISPIVCRELAEQTPEHLSLLDAPLCRGDDAAREGRLLILGGGDETQFDDVRPLLETTAAPEDIYYMGELGLGQVAKTANNILLWTALVADVEVFELCRTYGLDIDHLTDALSKSSGTNWGVNNWTERYPRNIPWAHKDMRIALEMAERQDVVMPFSGLLHQLVRALQDEWREYE